MTKRSMSITEIATSAVQKNAAIAASNVSPKARKHAATSSAVSSSTAGYCQPIACAQLRQRPRRSRYESTGMLSRGAIGASHDGQADGGWTIDRPSGSRDVDHVEEAPDREAREKRSASTRSDHAWPAFTTRAVLFRRTMSSWSS